MLTRKRQLKDWAFAISRRSAMRKARIALARRLDIIMHAMLRDGTAFVAAKARSPRCPFRASRRPAGRGADPRWPVFAARCR